MDELYGNDKNDFSWSDNFLAMEEHYRNVKNDFSSTIEFLATEEHSMGWED